jgi:hypothetical protein
MYNAVFCGCHAADISVLIADKNNNGKFCSHLRVFSNVKT